MRFTARSNEAQTHYRIANFQAEENTATFELWSETERDWRLIYLRRVGGEWFARTEKGPWNPCLFDPRREKFYLDGTQIQWFEGFVPSGLGDSADLGPKTDMPCKVVDVLVSVGDAVKKGQSLVILEAMKMENEIKSSKDGVIGEVFVKKGQALEADVTLLEFQE